MAHLGKMVAIAAAGTFCIATFPHVIPETFKKALEMENTPAPQELETHVCKIAAAMHLPYPERVKVFITPCFSCMSGGTTLLPRGATLGLSRTLLFDSEEDVRNSGITLNDKLVDWDSDAGTTLQHCLLQSTNHINFCIAHELAHVKQSDFIYYSLLPPAIITVSYFLLIVATPLLPVHLTRVALPAVFGLGMILYLQVQTMLNFYIEHRADRVAAETHRSFAEGGVEMMTKGIQLNSILNTELGTSRWPFGIGSSHPTFSERLCRLQELMKKHST